jgi:DedD protein
METRNVLLVVAAVSLFLIIVLAAGLWLFWPQSREAERAAAGPTEPPVGAPDEGFDTFEFYRGREPLPELAEEPDETQPGDLTITFGEVETTPEEEAVSVARRTPQTETISRPAPAAAPAPAPQAVAQPREPAPSPQPTSRPVAAKRPETVRIQEYWIQTASYTSRTRAESLSERLGAMGIAGAIKTREIEGTTYFRVRIGPYRNRDEADKFLGYIKGIKGLEGSYVSRVTRTQTN